MNILHSPILNSVSYFANEVNLILIVLSSQIHSFTIYYVHDTLLILSKQLLEFGISKNVLH